jgi:hypothetical protein
MPELHRTRAVLVTATALRQCPILASPGVAIASAPETY